MQIYRENNMNFIQNLLVNFQTIFQTWDWCQNVCENNNAMRFIRSRIGMIRTFLYTRQYHTVAICSLYVFISTRKENAPRGLNVRRMSKNTPFSAEIIVYFQRDWQRKYYATLSAAHIYILFSYIICTYKNGTERHTNRFLCRGRSRFIARQMKKF